MRNEYSFRAVLHHPPPKTNFTVAWVRPCKNTGFLRGRLDNSFRARLTCCLSPYQPPFRTMPKNTSKNCARRRFLGVLGITDCRLQRQGGSDLPQIPGKPNGSRLRDGEADFDEQPLR